MAAEDRRVFKMDTVLALLSGTGGNDLAGYLVGRDLSAQEVGVAATLAKAWLFKQNPAFMDAKYDEASVYEDWAKGEVKRLGADNVSITPIPEADVAPIAAVLETLANNKATIAAKDEEIAGLNEKVAELEPFQGKAGDLEKKVEELTAKAESLEGEKAELNKKVAEFSGKLPVAESELNSTIADIVTKALKDAVASVPMGAAAAPADGAAPAAEAAPAEEAGGGVPDDFGFGASGDDSAGFGF